MGQNSIYLNEVSLMKFFYLLLILIVITLIAIETKQSVKLPSINIDANASGMIYGSIGDGEIIILL